MRDSEKAHVVCVSVLVDGEVEVGAGDVLLVNDELGIVFLATEDIGDTGFEKLALCGQYERAFMND